MFSTISSTCRTSIRYAHLNRFLPIHRRIHISPRLFSNNSPLHNKQNQENEINTSNSSDSSSPSDKTINRLGLASTSTLDPESLDKLIRDSQSKRHKMDAQMKELQELQAKLAELENELSKKGSNLMWNTFISFMNSQGFKYLAVILTTISLSLSYALWKNNYNFLQEEKELQQDINKQTKRNTQLTQEYETNKQHILQVLNELEPILDKEQQQQCQVLRQEIMKNYTENNQR